MVDLSWTEDYGEPIYKGFDMTVLQMDEAYLHINVSPEIASNYYLYRKHSECIKCPWVVENFDNNDSVIYDGLRLILKNTPYNAYRISNVNRGLLNSMDPYICEFGNDFGEFGIYNVEVKNSNCDVSIIKNAVSVAFPVLTVFLIYCALFLVVFGSVYVAKRFILQSQENEKKPEGKKRVKSLDTFRGIAIVIMIFVNYGGGGFDVIDHANWNGLHLADLVFPWFMWIMGACVPMSLLSSFKRNLSNSEIFLNVLKRSIKLFCLGIFLNSNNSLECMRIFGVLQRFGICYLAITTICMFLMKRDLTIVQHKIGRHITDIICLAKGWIVIFIILFVYCMLLFFLADEGCPRGYLGPGGLHDDAKYFNCTGGATGYIDQVILGKHMYQYPTIKSIYLGSQAFDPEGILGCLTSIVHVFIGVQAGMVLQVYKKDNERILRWLVYAVVTGIIGGGLCGFSKDDGVIPLNKNLWSISFVLVTSCFAFTLLTVCYVLIDVKNWWTGKPLLFAGMNAILLYAGHEMTDDKLPMRWIVHCDQELGTHFLQLFQNLWGMGFWVFMSYYWYKIKFFYTI